MFHLFVEETPGKHRAIKTERLLTARAPGHSPHNTFHKDTPFFLFLPSPSALRSVPGHAFTIREDDLKAVRMRYHLGMAQHGIHTKPKWMTMESRWRINESLDFSQKVTQRIARAASAPKLGILTNHYKFFPGSSTPARHVKPAVAAATYKGARRNTCPAA